MFRNGNAAHQILVKDDFLPGEDVLEFLAPGSGGFPGDAHFLLLRGVVHFNQEHEAVQLGFRQGVGAFLFNGVLGGKHEKGGEQGEGAAHDGDAALLHGLQQGGLGFGGGAVDFVRQHDVGEHGPLDELELALAAGRIILDDVRAGNVRGHQVRRELDAVETKVQRFCHGTDQQRLRQARNSHQEGMPAGKQGDAQQLHDALLANDHFAQFRGKLLVNGAEPVNGGYVVVGQSGGDGFHIAIS